MPKRSHGRRPPRPKPRRGTRRSGPTPPSRRRREPDLMENIREALATGEPLRLLTIASALLSALSERPSVIRRDEPPVPRDDILQTFFEVPLLETSALLAAVAGLSGDDILRQRVRREIVGRAHVLPHWLMAMDEAESVDGVFEMKHVLGDGENVVVGLRLP